MVAVKQHLYTLLATNQITNETRLEAGIMAQRTFPRYFISRTDAGGSPSDETFSPAHVIDGFFIGARHLVDSECIVGADFVGNLQGLRDEDRDTFPETIQAELAWHEVSGGNRKRLLEVTEFFLFYLQLLGGLSYFHIFDAAEADILASFW